MAAVAVYDSHGDLLGFDVDGDGDADFTMPQGLSLIVDDDGYIEGFDLSGDGTVDYAIDTFSSLAAIDLKGDVIIDGLSLDGQADIDINLRDVAQLF